MTIVRVIIPDRRRGGEVSTSFNIQIVHDSTTQQRVIETRPTLVPEGRTTHAGARVALKMNPAQLQLFDPSFRALKFIRSTPKFASGSDLILKLVIQKFCSDINFFE